MIKHFFLVFCFLVLFFGRGYTQVNIYKAGETEHVGGQTFTYTIYTSEVPVNEQYAFWESAKFHVFNALDVPTAYRIKRKRVDVPSEWKDNLCWPPTCFTNLNANETNGYYITPSSGINPAPTLAENSLMVIGGEADGMIAEIKPQLYPRQPGSTATYRYIVSDESGNNDFDSITLVILYENDQTEEPEVPKEPTNSINQSTQSQHSISLMPNPASDFLQVQAENFERSILRIVDVLGNVVYSESFYQTAKINTANYKNGVYFVNITDDQQKNTITKKLIIRH